VHQPARHPEYLSTRQQVFAAMRRLGLRSDCTKNDGGTDIW
jgi:hypothetical protein